MLATLFLIFFVAISFVYGLGISNPAQYSMKSLLGRFKGQKPIQELSHVKS